MLGIPFYHSLLYFLKAVSLSEPIAELAASISTDLPNKSGWPVGSRDQHVPNFQCWDYNHVPPQLFIIIK